MYVKCAVHCRQYMLPLVYTKAVSELQVYSFSKQLRAMGEYNPWTELDCTGLLAQNKMMILVNWTHSNWFLNDGTHLQQPSLNIHLDKTWYSI